MSELTDAIRRPGVLMGAELAESADVFVNAITRPIHNTIPQARAIYTLARGSSDAVASILRYEYMARLGIAVASLPPSTFSLFGGARLDHAMALVISQSGGSDDLVRSAEGARSGGAFVAAIVNARDSAVEAAANLCVPIGAGPERAVPATKTVIGSIAAGMALLALMAPGYRAVCDAAAAVFSQGDPGVHPRAGALKDALLGARHVYVIGRGCGLGTAREVALKLKETCALHAESHSASEVLHGPLQLASPALVVVILDTGDEDIQPSLDIAQKRFKDAGSTVLRLRLSQLVDTPLAPPAAAALLLQAIYPIILDTALALGLNPDRPENLAKITRTL